MNELTGLPFIFFDEGILGIARYYAERYSNILYTGKPGSGIARATEDEHWIRMAGRNGWIGITKDSDVLRKKTERRAIVESSLRIFVLHNFSSAEEGLLHLMVESVWDRIPNWYQQWDPPSVARVFIKEGVIDDELIKRRQLKGYGISNNGLAIWECIPVCIREHEPLG